MKRYSCVSRIRYIGEDGYREHPRMICGEDEAFGLDSREWTIEELPADFESERDWEELAEAMGDAYDKYKMSGQETDCLVPESDAEVIVLAITIFNGNVAVVDRGGWFVGLGMARVTEVYEVKPSLLWS